MNLPAPSTFPRPEVAASFAQFTALPFTQVTLEDTFWQPRLEANRQLTIPFIYQQCLQTGRLDAFRPEGEVSAAARTVKGLNANTTRFWDSDVAKWLEAASYSLATHPHPELEKLVDELIINMAALQEPDGYLNTWFIKVDPANRWRNLRDWHELYNAGHLIEAGVAHFRATGKTSLLEVVQRYAGHIATQFGPEQGQRRGYCGHPEIELALIKLWQATGDKLYLNLSRYFVNERGQRPHYFDLEARERGEEPVQTVQGRAVPYEYSQSHLPVRQQTEVTGHAVRAVYLYSALADLAAIDGDEALLETCRRLWSHLTSRRMYVMGGIGSSAHNEGFTRDYDLPNATAYSETCAAIGLVFWAQRMLQIDLDRRYSDTMELALYNAVLSGIGRDGASFFYENPLASDGSYHRQPWFDCPCCPPNVARLLASLGGYVYSQSSQAGVVHLYIAGQGQFHLKGQDVTLQQANSYPWDGLVNIGFTLAEPVAFELYLRLPGWCSTPQLAVNGAAVELSGITEKGYARLDRVWQTGDSVTLDLPMPARRVYAHPEVTADRGRTALQRGPLVYCMEQVDQARPLPYLRFPAEAPLAYHFEPGVGGGAVVLTGTAQAVDPAEWEEALYRSEPPHHHAVPFRAVPYYAWDERAPGPMQVWLPE